jgi:peptide deformylase
LRERRPGTAGEGLTAMAILTILEYPDPRLHRVAKPVSAFDQRLRDLVRDMSETMYAAPGVGLAATQVDVHERVLVIDISEAKNELRVFVNPVVVWASAEIASCEEGCLSVPGIYDLVRRPAQVRVRAHDATGAEFELACEGTLAVCVQHEVDHLEGRVFVEHLSLLKQARTRAKLRKRRARG